jgi:hypothetical protein
MSLFSGIRTIAIMLVRSRRLDWQIVETNPADVSWFGLSKIGDHLQPVAGLCKHCLIGLSATPVRLDRPPLFM